MNYEEAFEVVTAAEIVAIHDRLLKTAPGLAGMPDPERAQAIYDRIKTLHAYGELVDVYDLAAAYLQAIARGHIFSDCNKRTAITCAAFVLFRNGAGVPTDGPELEQLTVDAATGEIDRQQIAATLRRM